MSSESQTAERPALSTELIPPTPGISGAAGEEEQTPFFAPRRRSLTLVDVDSAGALRPLTQAPSLTEVVQSFVGGRRGSVHSEDGDVQRPAAHRTDSTLARVLRGTLRRFTPEPSEGPLDEDFDREPDLTPPEAVHLTVDAVAATSTLDSATPGSSDILSPENHVETLDRSHLEPPSVPSPGRRRRQSWVELAADRMMSAILPKDAFEFDLSIHHSEDEKKFLGSYTAEDLKKYLVDFGIKDELSKRGLSDLFFKIDTSDPFVQRLTVTDASLLTPAQLAHEAPIVVSENNFIMDMWMRVRLDMRYHDFHAYQELVRLKDGDPGFLLKGSTPSNPSPHSQPNQLFQGINLSTHHVSIADMPPTEASEESSLLESTFTEPLNVTAVDWLEIQNPSGAFTKSRPPLPGQRHPGLKVARKVVSLILSLAEWKGRDCLSNTPNDWHNAYLYGRRGFMYVCPWMQGFVMAVEEELSADIEKYGLAPVAWAWRLGHVKRRDDGRVVIWSATQEQVYPTSARMRKYFTSDAYLNRVNKAREFYAGKFWVDFGNEGVQRDVKAAMGWGALEVGGA